MKNFRNILILSILTTFFYHCQKPVDYSNIPEVRFIKHELFDTVVLGNTVKKGKLTIEFTDGDGDIGYNDGDTTSTARNPIYGFNSLFIIQFEKVTGKYTQTALKIPMNYFIPYLTPEGQNKLVKAEFALQRDFYSNEKYDTIRYEIFIVDRAFNKSNIVTTPDIPMNNFGTISK